MINSICEKCALNTRCPMDSSSNILRCGFFIEKQNPEKIMTDFAEHFAALVAAKVIEQLQSENLILLTQTAIDRQLAIELSNGLEKINSEISE